MQNITALCNDAKTFPRNLNQQNPSASDVGRYEQLNAHTARLFSGEDQSSLDFLELGSSGKGRNLLGLEQSGEGALTVVSDFRSKCIKTEKLLRTHLGLTAAMKDPDPQCRFL